MLDFVHHLWLPLDRQAHKLKISKSPIIGDLLIRVHYTF